MTLIGEPPEPPKTPSEPPLLALAPPTVPASELAPPTLELDLELGFELLEQPMATHTQVNIKYFMMFAADGIDQRTPSEE